MKQTAPRRAFGVGLVAGVCLMTAGSAFAQVEVTFTKDIASILQQSCQGCHRTGEMAPMSLVTYDEVRPWARAIRTKVSERSMPPWHIDKTIGIQEFQNDISLSDEQIDTIVRWVDAGAPRGNPEDMPAANRVARQRCVASGGEIRPPARPRCDLAALDPECRGTGPVVGAGCRHGAHRRSMGDGS